MKYAIKLQLANQPNSLTKFWFHLFLFFYRKALCGLFVSAVGLMSRVLADSLGDRGSISGRVIPKTQKKMVLDAAREISCLLPYTSV